MEQVEETSNTETEHYIPTTLDPIDPKTLYPQKSLHHTLNRPSVTVAYLGPQGTYTHQAAVECFQESVQPVPVKTIADIFDSVKRNETPFGLVPVENSTNGSVTITLDLFREQDDLYVWNETYLQVSHCLLGTSDITKIKRLYSHSQAFGQCEVWLSRNLPHAERISTNSTSQAAYSAQNDPEGASISSVICADMYSLQVLAACIQDSNDNTTRFFIISKHPGNERDRGDILRIPVHMENSLHKTILQFTPNPLEQMAVSKCLLILAQYRMLSIAIRPSLKRDWHYMYFVELEGELSKNHVRDMELLCLEIRVLGSFCSRFIL